MKKSLTTHNVKPVNAVAARVTGKGVHFNRAGESNPCNERLEAPLAFLALPLDGENLIGLKAGNLEVVGYLGQNANEKHVWQARCLCGYYVRRTSKALLKQGSHLQCDDCDYREQIRRAYTFNQTGKWPARSLEPEQEAA